MIILAVVVFVMVYNLPSIKAFDNSFSKIIYHEQSFYGDIKIINLDPYRCLLVNGQMQSCANKEHTTDEVYIQLLKKMMDKIKPQRVLLVGLGGGSLLSVVSDQDKVDVVEIDPKLAQVVTDFDFLPQRDFNLAIEDARSFIRRSPAGAYDVVVVDALLGDNLPYYLFSQESLQQINRILAPKGMLLINTAAELAPDDLFSQALINTIQKVFLHTVVISGDSQYTPRPIIAAWNKMDAVELSEFQTIDLLSEVNTSLPVVTDEFNPLEAYYLKHSLELHQNNSALGQEIFFSK